MSSVATLRPNPVPVPSQMAHLPLDKRGYPIPAILQRDDNGMPLFAVNNELERQRAMREERCGICGKPLTRARWLVGGPGNAFHSHGAYLDPAMHGDCVHYALKVCPYLAAPKYSETVGKVLAQRAGIAVNDDDPQATNERPPLFVAVQYVGQKFVMGDEFGLPIIRYTVPKRPYWRVEYWLRGQQLDADVGSDMAAAHMKALAEERPQWAQ